MEVFLVAPSLPMPSSSHQRAFALLKLEKAPAGHGHPVGAASRVPSSWSLNCQEDMSIGAGGGVSHGALGNL